MGRRRRRLPEPSEVQPLDVDGVRAVSVGTVLWAAAFVVLALRRDSLEAAGRGWWVWTALAGVGVGLLGLEYCRKRRDSIARAMLEAEAAADDEPWAGDPGGEAQLRADDQMGAASPPPVGVPHAPPVEAPPAPRVRPASPPPGRDDQPPATSEWPVAGTGRTGTAPDRPEAEQVGWHRGPAEYDLPVRRDEPEPATPGQPAEDDSEAPPEPPPHTTDAGRHQLIVSEHPDRPSGGSMGPGELLRDDEPLLPEYGEPDDSSPGRHRRRHTRPRSGGSGSAESDEAAGEEAAPSAGSADPADGSTDRGTDADRPGDNRSGRRARRIS